MTQDQIARSQAQARELEIELALREYAKCLAIAFGKPFLP